MVFNTTFFPISQKINRNRNRVLIGIGCNIGNCVRRFKKLFQFFKSHPSIEIIQTAPLYKNPPFGYLEQNDFINTLIVIDTNLNPFQLLNFLLYTEKKFGRKRLFKNGPRTLDLDIIMFNNLKINKKKLTVPHPFFKERVSVILPLYLLGKR
jgi:2-amino-4-hydroxy-6-hydroxymethyldihydropteridine diphosphokinase